MDHEMDLDFSVNLEVAKDIETLLPACKAMSHYQTPWRRL